MYDDVNGTVYSAALQHDYDYDYDYDYEYEYEYGISIHLRLYKQSRDMSM